MQEKQTINIGPTYFVTPHAVCQTYHIVLNRQVIF